MPRWNDVLWFAFTTTHNDSVCFCATSFLGWEQQRPGRATAPGASTCSPADLHQLPTPALRAAAVKTACLAGVAAIPTAGVLELGPGCVSRTAGARWRLDHRRPRLAARFSFTTAHDVLLFANSLVEHRGRTPTACSSSRVRGCVTILQSSRLASRTSRSPSKRNQPSLVRLWYLLTSHATDVPGRRCRRGVTRMCAVRRMFSIHSLYSPRGSCVVEVVIRSVAVAMHRRSGGSSWWSFMVGGSALRCHACAWLAESRRAGHGFAFTIALSALPIHRGLVFLLR